MTTPILFLIAGTIGFTTVITLLFFHACKLSREGERDRLPDMGTDIHGAGGGEVLIHHGSVTTDV